MRLQAATMSDAQRAWCNLLRAIPSRFCAPAMSLLMCQKMPPQRRPMTRAMTQCMSSSVGLRMISVNVRLYSTASSRVIGVRGGFLCCSSTTSGISLGTCLQENWQHSCAYCSVLDTSCRMDDAVTAATSL